VIAPIVLAAGASSRMNGKPKQFLDFIGETCLEVMVRAVKRPGTSEPIVVLGNKAVETRERIWLDGCKLVVNQAWENGQTSSVQTGLRAVPEDTEGMLLVPVDLPLMLPEDTDAVLRAFAGERDRFDVFVATVGGRRGHPVLFSRRVFPEILALAHDQALSSVVRREGARVKEVSVRNPGIVASMNTPEEYAGILAEFQVRTYRETAGQFPPPRNPEEGVGSELAREADPPPDADGNGHQT